MISIKVGESSEVAKARRRATQIAEQSGYSTADAGRAALVAIELATNLVNHAGGGEILTGPFEEPTGRGVEIIALDRGPGIADLQACLADGYSSAGTAGNGLGAIFRQSHTVEIASEPQIGTAILARLEQGAPPTSKKRKIGRA